MSKLLKQTIFFLTAIAILVAGGLAIKSATPSGYLKIKPSLTAKVKMVKQENTTTTGNNPVGWWKMDEGTASSSYDSSGNGNTGTLTGGVQWTTGKLDKGLSFDGVNDYVSASFAIDTDINRTFVAWIKPLSYGQTTGRIIDISSIPRIYLSSSNKVNVDTDGGTGFTISSANNSINYSVWQQIVVVINPTEYVTIYINGVLAGNGQGGSYSGAATNLFIGNRTGADRTFNGLIDDVRIYNRALSAGEVGQMWSSTKDGYLGNIKISTGLISYLKMDEANWATSVGATAVVKDLSGKLNNGTPYNHASTTGGQIGRAGIFDGIGDYVSANVNRTDLTTISFWIKPNSTTQNILELNATNSIAIASGVVQATGFGTPTIYVDGVSTTSLPNTNWHFITINPTIKMAGNGLNLGKVSTSYYAGLLDDFKVYNYSRSSEQIKNDYIRGASGREQ